MPKTNTTKTSVADRVWNAAKSDLIFTVAELAESAGALGEVVGNYLRAWEMNGYVKKVATVPREGTGGRPEILWRWITKRETRPPLWIG